MSWVLDQGFSPLPFIFPSNSWPALLQIANSKGTSIHIVIFYWQVFIEPCRDKVLWRGWVLQTAMWHIQIYVQRKTYYSSLACKTSLDLMASSSSYKYLFYVWSVESSVQQLASGSTHKGLSQIRWPLQYALISSGWVRFSVTSGYWKTWHPHTTRLLLLTEELKAQINN